MKENKLHVLYLPRWYPNRYDPMPGLFIERHARSVSDHVDVSVLYVHPDDQQREKKYHTDFSEDEELKQLKIYYRTSGSPIGFVRKLVNLFRYFRANISGIRKISEVSGRPDLIHVNVLTRLGIIAWFYKRYKGIPYVITEHWTRYLPMTDTYHGALRKYFTKVVVKNAAAVLPVTVNLQKAMEANGLRNSNYRVIPNVVDIRMFRPAEKATNNEEMANLIHVSCFEDKQKNISGLLRVLRKLSERRKDWMMEMVGDGIHFDQLVDLGEELGLKDRFVNFHGLMEGEALVRQMQKADFQVLFSRYENLPVVILEGYSCGVPVLSTDVGGIREHLNEDLGVLIDSEDEEVLLENLQRMIDRRDQYDRRKIREYAVAHFSREVIGKSLYEVYREVTR